MSKITADPNGSVIAPVIRTVMEEMNLEFFERRDAIHAIWVGLFAGANTYFLGDPGTGKSLLVRSTGGRVTGSNNWETLLDRQLPMETIFGPIDIIEFKTTGKYHRNTDGYLPWAHFIFLDEVGKAGPATLNPLLTALNEGIYHNNSKPMKCNILTAVGASNEELEPELAAMWDRWMLRLIIQPIQEAKNFAALLQGGKSNAKPTTVTLEQVIEARENEVPKVTLPSGIVDSIMQLKAELRAEQVSPSDRRWKQAVPILQANAWLNGRSAVDEDDLAILRHVLWDVVEQIPVVERIVLQHTSEFAAKAMEFSATLDDVEGGIDSRKGQSAEKRAAYGAEAQGKIRGAEKGLAELIEKANREGRATDKLDDVMSRVRSIKVRIFVECLNVPADKAGAFS